ncbi:DUF2225 domain-containing protein [Clostridium bovifaecis]|uniref:DUF2225 domain-containing protein n=1 Tax=Clostridium bovifaecis TaxID=2184719 RepID=A0A6I6F701_9CLOT|nr:DUF2225 domain-containing protein [Clostridium bovifaecis]
MNNILSGLDELGFSDINHVELYTKNSENENKDKELAEQNIQKEMSYLYDKKIICPVCGANFTVKAIKTSSYKMKSKDSDFFIKYELINPYFYDVWICNDCGYSAMKADFEKIKSFQKELVKTNITSKWKGRSYSVPYDINTAIERYKLSLLNYFYIEAKSSKKAMNCLKLAWLFRMLEDTKSEQDYLIQALKGFDEAYFNEDFPIYGMNKFTVMYLIGELHRRLGNTEDALLWFGNVITSSNSPKKIKDMAREQKDLIKKPNILEEEDSSQSNSSKKKGFFSSFFSR